VKASFKQALTGAKNSQGALTETVLDSRFTAPRHFWETSHLVTDFREGIKAMNVRFEQTPNPQTLKFSVAQTLTDEPAEFKSQKETLRSPLAKKLFGFPWCDGVYIGRDFVTVTKQDWVDWDVLAEPLAGLIGEHLERNEPVLNKLEANASEVNADDSPVVQQIKKILNEEIRPAVALDGGDIVFNKYENNIVYIFMQGSCAGCPSSTITLKEGIENRLRNEIPEIKEVISL
jgi:Fe-S cluster biogenesis protein NfuA